MRNSAPHVLDTNEWLRVVDIAQIRDGDWKGRFDVRFADGTRWPARWKLT